MSEPCALCGALPCDQVEGPASWQPVETAPKDGRELLLAFGCGIGDVPAPLICAWSVNDGHWLVVGAELEVLTQPTHWMPLPAAPEPSE